MSEEPNKPASNLPAIVPPENSPLNPYNPFLPTDDSGAFFTTLDLNKGEYAWLVQEILTGEADSIDKWIGKVFTAHNVVGHPWSKTDSETGEIVAGLRTILVGNDGSTCAFTGSGALKCLRRVTKMPGVGLPPWPNGIPLEIGQIPVGDKKRSHTIKVTKDFLNSVAKIAPKPRSSKV